MTGRRRDRSASSNDAAAWMTQAAFSVVRGTWSAGMVTADDGWFSGKQAAGGWRKTQLGDVKSQRAWRNGGAAAALSAISAADRGKTANARQRMNAAESGSRGLASACATRAC